MAELNKRSSIKELDGFTNAETRAFYRWISESGKEIPSLEPVFARAADGEELGSRLLDWFMCYLHEQPGINIFYDTVVDKAILGVHWNEVGARLFDPDRVDPVDEQPEVTGLQGADLALYNWVLAEKGDALAGKVSSGADAAEIMEYLEDLVAGVHTENGLLNALLGEAKEKLKFSLVTAALFKVLR